MSVEKENILTVSRKLDTVDADPCNFAGCRRDVANSYAHRLDCVKKAKHALATAHFAPNQEAITRAIYKQFPELNPKYLKDPEMPKKKPDAVQKKIETVMSEYKQGELNIGTSDKKVKNHKQAVAIALHEAGVSKKRNKNKKSK